MNKQEITRSSSLNASQQNSGSSELIDKVRALYLSVENSPRATRYEILMGKNPLGVTNKIH